MEASSLQSKNISTTQTTTLNLTTSSTRSSLPSQEKITKKNEVGYNINIIKVIFKRTIGWMLNNTKSSVIVSY
ncbi:unnamed protein product, partial [Rotaria sp. Silwood2]